MRTRTARRSRRAIPLALCALSAPPLLPAGTPSVSPVEASHPRALQTARIREIQGAGHLSPIANAEVSGVTGVVTAKRAGGFFMQDAAPDADARTSEGIFVLTGSAPADVLPGDSVRVGGTVREQRQGGDAPTNAN